MVGTGISAAGYTLLFGITVVAAGWDGIQFRMPLLFVAIGCVIGFVLAAQNRAHAVGSVALGAVWIQVHYSLYTLSEFPSPSLLASPALLVSAALLLSPRASRLFGIATVAMPWLVAVFGAIGRDHGMTASMIFWLCTHSVVMLVIWFVVTLGFSALDRAYLDVVAKERALAETPGQSFARSFGVACRTGKLR